MPPDYTFLLNLLGQIPLVAAVVWVVFELDKRQKKFIKDLIDEFREAEQRREERYKEAENRLFDIILHLLGSGIEIKGVTND